MDLVSRYGPIKQPGLLNHLKGLVFGGVGQLRSSQGSTRALFGPGLPSPGSKFGEGEALTKFAGSANLQGLPSHSYRNGKGLKIFASNPAKHSTANVHNEFHHSCPLPN